MTIRVVKSGIPRPLANYNEAFVAGDLVFAAGQLASDFKTGVPPEARKQHEFSVLRLGHQAADRLHPAKT